MCGNGGALAVGPQAESGVRQKVAYVLLKPAVLWFTGLSAAGKTTTAAALKQVLSEAGCPVVLLDGDQLRTGLCADLGFGLEDRAENIRRTGEVAGLFAREGYLVLVTLISPLRQDRDRVRQRLAPLTFLEIFVATPLETCERRDLKGLYQSARSGRIHNLTGIDSPYEPPLAAEMVISTEGVDTQTLVQQLLDGLVQRGVISG